MNVGRLRLWMRTEIITTFEGTIGRLRYSTPMKPSAESTTPSSWIKSFVEEHGGSAGTVHKRDGEGEVLKLWASVNIPPKVQELTATIGKGKGMAGLAWERGKPVQTCNLQTDTSGDVRPGAKSVGAKAAVAIPIYQDQEFWGVVGIAFSHERELADSVLQSLTEAAHAVVDL